MTHLPNKLMPNLARSELLVVSLTLTLVIFAWTLASILNPRIDSTDRNVVATGVLKDMEPNLFPRDTLFANDEIYRYYTPLYRWIVAQVWRWGGTFEAGFIWLLPLVLGFYLVGMFILIRWVTANTWIALGLTVAAAHYHNVMGASGWGVGGSTTLGARTLFMPVAPFLALLWLKILQKPDWRIGLIFGLLLGLATNLHPISGFHFLTLSSFFLVLLHSHTWRGWQTLGVIAFAVGLGGWPIGWHFLQNAGKPIGPEITFAVFSKIVTELYPLPFSPERFQWPMLNIELTRPFLDGLVWFYLALALFFGGGYLWGRQRWPGLVRWGWLIAGLITVCYAHLIALFELNIIFVVVGAYIGWRCWQGIPTQLEGWLIAWMGLIVGYSFVGYYLFYFAWQRFELWSATSFLTEFARSAAFVYLPVYLLVGLGGVAWAKGLAHKFPKIGTFADFSLGVALVLALAPSAAMYFSENLFLTLLASGLTLLITILILVIKRWLLPPWPIWVGGVALILIWFGPAAPFLSGYLPIPAVNLFQPANWLPQPRYEPVDAQLYSWVQQHTAPEALFFGCFGPVTMTHFRFRAQRSISHNWKDLTFNLHNRVTLVPAYQRFRKLEAACKSFDGIITQAQALKADYILVSSEKAATFLSKACFANSKYAIFTLSLNDCSSN